MAIKSNACLEVMITIVDSSLEHKLSDYFKKLHPPYTFLPMVLVWHSQKFMKY